MKKLSTLPTAIIIGIFLFALAFRLSGLFNNHPFWVDEFSSAAQAKLLLKYGLGVFTNPNLYFESNNIVTHAIIALSFVLFGFHEWAARIPFAIIGSMVPVLVYFLGKKISDTWVGVGAAMLTATSYFMIVWSRQARGYMLLIALILAGIYVYIRVLEKSDTRKIILFVTLCLLGVATHTSYVLLIASFGLHFVLTKYSIAEKIVKKPQTYIAIAVMAAIAFFVGLPSNIYNAYTLGTLGANNVWYYHSFLWREYPLITFLGAAGLATLLIQKKKYTFLLYFFAFHLIFFNFVFKPYNTRYMLPLFPILFIGMAYLFSLVVQSVTKQRAWILLPVCFIIANGNKFDLKPNPYYSINHDFREVALIDYDQIYSIIQTKGKLSEGKTAVIDTWWDRLRWYVGDDFGPIYAFRWANSPGLINGLPKFTPYVMRNGEKVIPQSQGVRLVANLSDLNAVMNKYPRGFLFVDDESMPADVIQYAKQHLKKELYLDRYPLDDNPLSLWPTTLYSWGL